MTEREDLKPCPFCGADAEDGSQGMVQCRSCGAAAFGPKWNRRTGGLAQTRCTCGSDANQPASHHDISCPLTISASIFEQVFIDACDEAGCPYDNEALLKAIADLKRAPAQAPANLPDRERMAEILYTASHKGLRNCWKWSDGELDHEHPASRGYWYKIADGTLSALSSTPSEHAQAGGNCGEPVAWLLERQYDPTFPRVMLSREHADALITYANVNPPVTIQPLYGASPVPSTDRHCEFCHIPMAAADCCDSEFESKGCAHTSTPRETGK